jgi:hypothetical protein
VPFPDTVIGDDLRMAEAPYPTDPDRERALGRIPVWLPVDLVRWLVDHDLCGHSPEGHHEAECVHIRFRADSALHHEGLKD